LFRASLTPIKNSNGSLSASGQRENQMNSGKQSSRGFTLIEIMITVAIIAILSAIAIPSYFQYVVRSNRAEAKTVMLQASQFFERSYTVNNSYCGSSCGSDLTVAVTVALPATLIKTPSSGTTLYDLTATASQSTYTISATPTLTGSMKNDKCGTLTYNNLGVKGQATTGDVATCWRS
jgi:type IV pilus assembly protein PilE